MPERTAGLSARKTRKRKDTTLAESVRRPSGVPLGARGSLRNMLVRSLGAGSFAEFWRYWNPMSVNHGLFNLTPFRCAQPPLSVRRGAKSR